MKKTYTINGIEFQTQGAAKDHAKAILYAGQVGTVLSPADQAFMIAYFEQFHNNWPQKVGSGIKNIAKVVEPNYGKLRAFFIFRTDGTCTDISYGIKKPNPKGDFKKALRQSIVPQVIQYKRRRFDLEGVVLCEITGEALTFETAHVDHSNPTFDEIAEAFISMERILDFDGLVIDGRDNHTVYELYDKSVEQRFWLFHRERAVYRILSAIANLSHAKHEFRERKLNSL